MPRLTEDALHEVQRRLRAAYDPRLLTAATHRFAELLGEHFHKVETSQGRVLNWEEPARNVELAAEIIAEAAQAGFASRNDAALGTLERAGAGSSEMSPTELSSLEPLLGRFAELMKLGFARGQNIHDPRYVGHQVPASLPLAGLFDAAGSTTNQVMAVYEMGPWATAVERAMVERLGEEIGWKRGEFAGLVTHGGSLANLTALLTARNVVLGDVWERGMPTQSGKPVLVSHADAHYCIARSAGVLGLGTDQVIPAALDERRRMDPHRLDELLGDLRRQNRPIVAVVACACATPIGAFDPLDDIAEVCRRHEVWMHVDAAHGGAACLSERHRHLVRGLDRVDSLIWDAHKMMFVPALCAFVFYRNREHRFEAFRQNAPYLFDPSAPGLADYDSGLLTVECTKRAAVLGLFGAWSLFGRQIFADLVDVTFDLGTKFYELLSEQPDFTPLHVPQCNIVAFRHVPATLTDAPPSRIGQFQLDIRRELIRSGDYYLVPTSYEGHGALRVTIINPLTTVDHLRGLLDAIRETGRKISAGAV